MSSRNQLSFDMTDEPEMSDVPCYGIEEIQHKVDICMQIAASFFGKAFDRPSANLRQKGRAAGTAHLQKNELRFNAFMYQQNPSLFLDTVVPHEIAHILVYQIYGGNVRPHGKEWRAVMKKVYGLQPDRTHCFDVPKPKQSFAYHCSCQTHTFTKQRHSRAQKGTDYICKMCRSKLHFVDS